MTITAGFAWRSRRICSSPISPNGTVISTDTVMGRRAPESVRARASRNPRVRRYHRASHACIHV
jgi:hypothetical protein